MSKLDLVYCDSPSALAQTAATRWLDQLRARSSDVPYGVALSGGRIAKPFFESIVRSALNCPVQWSSIHFFWADERCVPPTDNESNFRVAKESLFAPLGIEPGNVHRIFGEVDADYAAAQAEAEICRILPLTNSGQPVLDMAFLGMGGDGHVASLFPGESVDRVEDPAVYRSVEASKPLPKRITIGYPTLVAARNVWVLVSGSGKERVIREVTSGGSDLPIGVVVSRRTSTLIFNDNVKINT